MTEQDKDKKATKAKPATDDAPAEEKIPTPEQEVDAALAEVDGKDADEAHAEFAGVEFTFSRRKLDSVQFRRLMQRNWDLRALEYLLGAAMFDKLMAAAAGPDGVTSDDDFAKLWPAISAVAGTGNSSGSTN